MRKFSKILIVGVLLFGLAASYLPWKSWIEEPIKEAMRAQGLDVAELTVSSLSYNHIHLKDIQIGREKPMTLPSLSIGYSALDLLQSRLEDIDIQDLRVEVRQEQGAWRVSGVQSTSGGVFGVPDSEEAVEAIALNRLKIENSTAIVEAPFANARIPFSVFWDKPAREVLLSAKGMEVQAGDLRVAVSDLRGVLHFKDRVWSGSWSADGIEVMDVTAAQAKGTWRIQDQILIVEGQIEAPDMKGKSTFSLRIPLDGQKLPVLSLSKTEFPWSDGMIRMEKANIPMDGKTPVRLMLDVENVALDALMKVMMGQEISSSGTISGTIPVIVKPDGTLTLGKTHLAANGNGFVSLPANLIPGAGDQIELTRQVLSNFEYDGLSVDVVEEAGGKISFLLNVSGKNPKVYDGRAVKLNVRLGGDVLEFLQSNMMLLMKPESVLTQEKK